MDIAKSERTDIVLGGCHFQLQDGGWIRRQAFWVAKQVLQLGMGDAFDDWLIDKIQLLRKGEVIALAIGRIEQILWPDGIFLPSILGDIIRLPKMWDYLCHKIKEY